MANEIKTVFRSKEKDNALQTTMFCFPKQAADIFPPFPLSSAILLAHFPFKDKLKCRHFYAYLFVPTNNFLQKKCENCGWYL